MPGVSHVLVRRAAGTRRLRRSKTQRREIIGGIIAFIVLGLLAGIMAKALLPGEDPGGFIVTAIIGIVGALLGGSLAAAIVGAHTRWTSSSIVPPG